MPRAPKKYGYRGRWQLQVSIASMVGIVSVLCCGPCNAFLFTTNAGMLSHLRSLETTSLFPSTLSTQYLKGRLTDSVASSALEAKLRGRDTSFEEEDVILGLPRQSVVSPLILLLFSQFVLFIGVGAVIPTIPLYGKEIGLSASANGIVISAPAIALLLLANFAGQYADQARKPAMIGGMALIAASDVGTAFSSSLPPLIVARMGLGAGRAVSEAGERGLLADLASRVPELRGKILAAQQATVALGIAIGAPLGGVVVEMYGPRAAFLCVSAAAIAALVLYLFLPETVVDPKSGYEGTTLSEGDDADEGDWIDLLQDDRWKGLALCQMGLSFTFAAKISVIPLLASEYLPGGAVGAGALLSAAGFGGLVGAPLGGWLIDKTGARITAVLVSFLSAIALLLVPFALSPLSSVFMTGVDGIAFKSNIGAFSTQATAFSALVILWSIGAAAQGPALTAIAQELAPIGAEAKSLALPRAAGDGTYIIAPYVLGLAEDNYSEAAPGIACAVAGGMMVLGTLALIILGGQVNPDEKLL